MFKAIAILALTTSPALAAGQMLCAENLTNKEVLDNLEKNAKEVTQFVGISYGGFPVELTLSPEGGWSVIIVTPDATCFLGGGKSGQIVEPKPAGVEN